MALFITPGMTEAQLFRRGMLDTARKPNETPKERFHSTIGRLYPRKGTKNNRSKER